jgi:hypothetical protein
MSGAVVEHQKGRAGMRISFSAFFGLWNETVRSQPSKIDIEI